MNLPKGCLIGAIWIIGAISILFILIGSDGGAWRPILIIALAVIAITVLNERRNRKLREMGMGRNAQEPGQSAYPAPAPGSVAGYMASNIALDETANSGEVDEEEVKRLTAVIQEYANDLARLYNHMKTEDKYLNLINGFLERSEEWDDELLFNQDLINFLEASIFCKAKDDSEDLARMKIPPVFGTNGDYPDVLFIGQQNEFLVEQYEHNLVKMEMWSGIMYNHLHDEFKLGKYGFMAATWIAVMQLATHNYAVKFHELFSDITNEIINTAADLDGAITIFAKKLDPLTVDNQTILGFYYYLLHHKTFGEGDPDIFEARQLFEAAILRT